MTHVRSRKPTERNSVSPKRVRADRESKWQLGWMGATRGQARIRNHRLGVNATAVGVRGLVSAFVVAVSTLLPSVVRASWSSQTVVHYGDMGQQVSLALDSQGRPHVTYLENDYLALKYALYYAFWDGASWQTMRVSSAGDSLNPTALVLDSNDRPHVCFTYAQLAGSPIAYHATFDGSAWTGYGIDVGVAGGIAIDNAGLVHISYYYPYGIKMGDDVLLRADLKYARGSGQTWHTETIEYGGRIGEWSSIAIDPAQRPRIAYHDYGVLSSSLKHAAWDGSVWNIEVVDANGNAGDNPSLAIDSEGRSCVSYAGGKDLRFASRQAAGWEVEVVEASAAGYSLPNSLALDENDRPHISYQMAGDHLRYAVRNPAFWARQVVDTLNTPGLSNSIAIDGNQRPHIMYYETIDGDLKYATMSGGDLVVSKTGDRIGSVSSNPAGINCGDDCIGTFDAFGVVELTATAAGDAVFVGWSGDCAGSDSKTTVVTNGLSWCIAEFSAARPLDIDGPSWVACGEEQQFTASGGTPPYSWRLSVDNTGAELKASGFYTAGTSTGRDTLVVVDSLGVEGSISVAVNCSAPLVVVPRVSAGGSHSLAIDATGALWAWGDNAYGQVGDGTTSDRSRPVLIGTGYLDAAGEYGHSIGVKVDGTIWAWGNNTYGQLGDGSTTSRLTPTLVATGNFVAITVGANHSLALDASGTLWAWGRNAEGQLGDGSRIDRHSPVAVGDGFSAIAATRAHSLGLKSDGTLWGWGDNGFGQLGDGTTTDRLTPVLIGSGFVSMDTGSGYTVAIKKDGTLWAWGDNGYGQLGDGTTTDRLTPVQVGSGFVAVATGGAHTLGLRENGELWAWGQNNAGQLGIGDKTNRSTPVLVGSGFIQVDGGDGATGYGRHSVALKADGTLWAWGENGDGQLGIGSTEDRLTPTLVGRWFTPATTGCGDGGVGAGEQCDAGAANGTVGSCCTTTCTYRSAGTVCRPSVGDCDVAESCSGSSPTCPVNGFAQPQTACDDGDACTATDSCDGSGTCMGFVRDCSHGPECVDGGTSRTYSNGSCKPLSGTCEFVFTDSPCAQGCDLATGLCTDDACFEVSCVEPPTECHVAPGSCAEGVCSYERKHEGATCDDHDACTERDTCDESGHCRGVPTTSCGAGGARTVESSSAGARGADVTSTGGSDDAATRSGTALASAGGVSGASGPSAESGTGPAYPAFHTAAGQAGAFGVIRGDQEASGGAVAALTSGASPLSEGSDAGAPGRAGGGERSGATAGADSRGESHGDRLGESDRNSSCQCSLPSHNRLAPWQAGLASILMLLLRRRRRGCGGRERVLGSNDDAQLARRDFDCHLPKRANEKH